MEERLEKPAQIRSAGESEIKDVAREYRCRRDVTIWESHHGFRELLREKRKRGAVPPNPPNNTTQMQKGQEIRPVSEVASCGEGGRSTGKIGRGRTGYDALSKKESGMGSSVCHQHQPQEQGVAIRRNTKPTGHRSGNPIPWTKRYGFEKGGGRGRWGGVLGGGMVR